MHRFEMSELLDRERYLRKTSDRLHDRFLEQPAFHDLDVIRSEIKKLEMQIEESMASGLSWSVVMNRLGEPTEYADAVYAQILLGPGRFAKVSQPSVLLTVLKILLITAPINFLFALGPLIFSSLMLVIGWVVSVIVILAPLLVGVDLAITKPVSLGLAEILFLIAAFSLGSLVALAMIGVSRFVFWMIWKWLGWNIAFLRSGPGR